MTRACINRKMSGGEKKDRKRERVCVRAEESGTGRKKGEMEWERATERRREREGEIDGERVGGRGRAREKGADTKVVGVSGAVCDQLHS